MKTRSSQNRLFLLAALFGLLLSCSPSSSPSKELGRDETPTSVRSSDPHYGEEAKANFKTRFVDDLASGFSLSLQKGEITIPGSEGKKNNVLSFGGTKAKFALSSLSLHGISLALDGDIAYGTGEGGEVERNLGLLLTHDWLFLDAGLSTASQAPSGQSDLRYRVNLASYEGEYSFDEDGGLLSETSGSIDPLTGG
ncbi:MAG: hypothetical protein HUJ60_01540, partial [Bacilli bacterium]|nr:hypothetical protein [Bacilli bacterium]